MKLSPETRAKLDAVPTSHKLQHAIAGMVRSFILNDHRHIHIDTKLDTLRLMLNEFRLQAILEVVEASLTPDEADQCCHIMAKVGLACVEEQEKNRTPLKNLVSLYRPTNQAEGKN